MNALNSPPRGQAIMERKDVPAHIREAAFIMQGVFARILDHEEKNEEWEEDGEVHACCR